MAHRSVGIKPHHPDSITTRIQIKSDKMSSEAGSLVILSATLSEQSPAKASPAEIKGVKKSGLPKSIDDPNLSTPLLQPDISAPQPLPDSQATHTAPPLSFTKVSDKLSSKLNETRKQVDEMKSTVRKAILVSADSDLPSREDSEAQESYLEQRAAQFKKKPQPPSQQSCWSRLFSCCCKTNSEDSAQQPIPAMRTGKH